MAKYKVYVSDGRHDHYDIERKMLEAIDAELIISNCATEDDIIANCADADGILLDLAPMTRKAIAGLTKCKVINRYGVGFDNVDVAACTEKGIQVTNVPDYCAEDVSDHAMALMFSCMRHVSLRDRKIRQGEGNISGVSFRMKGKVLGVLGFGRIARALVSKCSGLGFSKILVYEPYVPAEAFAPYGAQKAELEEVLAQCDLLSLHMPVTPQTTGMINADTLALMKPTAILVNTGRGPLVNDAALIDALKNHKILAAGLDTHCVEPLPADSEYLKLDNVVLTDHTAYSTMEAVEELKTKAAQNIINALTGVAPVYPVNKL